MERLTVQIKEASYHQKSPTIKDVHFSLKKGELVGLIGPNGAGKSTTIKSMIGLMENLEGMIHFHEEATYAYIPERPVFYDELTLWEHLDFIATVQGMDEKEFHERAMTLLTDYRLKGVAHHLPATFSKGMQQKAMIVFALLEKPSIYMIDEPFVGLDPISVKLLLTSLKREKERGASILLSTHVLDTAEKVCDRFLLMNEGRIVASGTLDDIKKEHHLNKGSLFDYFVQIVEG